MRLIDADVLIERIKEEKEDNDVHCRLCMDATIDIIDAQPTVEAKPVVHGKWEQRTEWDEDNNAIFECTNCRHGDVQAKGAEVPYCWYCGADMRGGKNGRT